MKRTDLEKRERELKRAKKKLERTAREGGEGSDRNIGDYIKELHGLFYHDEERIFNSKESIEILELFEDMKIDLDSSQWDNVLRKAIKKTGVKEREKAFEDLKHLLGEADSVPESSEAESGDSTE